MSCGSSSVRSGIAVGMICGLMSSMNLRAEEFSSLWSEKLGVGFGVTHYEATSYPSFPILIGIDWYPFPWRTVSIETQYVPRILTNRNFGEVRAWHTMSVGFQWKPGPWELGVGTLISLKPLDSWPSVKFGYGLLTAEFAIRNPRVWQSSLSFILSWDEYSGGGSASPELDVSAESR